MKEWKNTGQNLPHFVSCNTFNDMARHLALKRYMTSAKNIDFATLAGKLDDKATLSNNNTDKGAKGN